MILWDDSQLSQYLAPWLAETFGMEAHSAQELGLLQATDREIYQAAREAGAVIMTKDNDFLGLLNRLGSPPQVLWITCGNTSNARLRQILQEVLPTALDMLEQGEPLVEISDAN